MKSERGLLSQPHRYWNMPIAWAVGITYCKSKLFFLDISVLFFLLNLALESWDRSVLCATERINVASPRGFTSRRDVIKSNAVSIFSDKKFYVRNILLRYSAVKKLCRIHARICDRHRAREGSLCVWGRNFVQLSIGGEGMLLIIQKINDSDKNVREYDLHWLIVLCNDVEGTCSFKTDIVERDNRERISQTRTL